MCSNHAAPVQLRLQADKPSKEAERGRERKRGEGGRERGREREGEKEREKERKGRKRRAASERLQKTQCDTQRMV